MTDITRLVNELTSAENGVVALFASTGQQQSRESPEWKNGSSLLPCLKRWPQGIHYRGSNSLYITDLEGWVGEHVKELTQGLQTPVAAKPAGTPDFPVAVVTQQR